MLFVGKKDGGMRPCVNYQKLNDITVKNRYPIPNADDLCNVLTGATVYSKIDLKDAFNQIRIKEGDEYKTAFKTRYGLYKYLVMPFGLCNAPSTFQRMINTVLGEFLDQCCVAYLDDILVYSKTQEEHLKHLELVLEKLSQANLHVKLKKCEFFQPEVEFLGYIVKTGGFAMAQDKVEAVTSWPVPTCRKDVRSFLGLANYCRDFIKKIL